MYELQSDKDSNSPVAVAVAVITFPLTNAGDIPVNDQAPPTPTVVVPICTPFLYTLITVPDASVEVPETDVAPLAIGVVIVGQSER